MLRFVNRHSNVWGGTLLCFRVEHYYALVHKITNVPPHTILSFERNFVLILAELCTHLSGTLYSS